ncbi:MAG TPA: transketolase [Thermoplasmata archaeon]|nr:transketolase [Thermoplasmata archaeon]
MATDETPMVNTLRFLAVDMVEAAKSGHPGLPLGAAPMAYVLWDRFLKHNPADPAWPDRDRFVLSAGHGSALLYALLHVTGYDLTLDDLKRFRQYGSRTPGHPEYPHTAGVVATTGPLGQGFAMGVGMALAERYLAARFNRPGFEAVDHWTYVLCSDGDLMEGISSEAASFAGTMRVPKLVYLYDDNRISLDGPTPLTFTEDVGRRFEAYGWRVDAVADGNDLGAIDAAIRAAKAAPDRPSLIRVRTHIGYGSPRQDTREAHGEALGPAMTIATKEKLGWPTSPPFLVPEAAATHFGRAKERGAAWQRAWTDRMAAYRAAFPELAREYAAMLGRERASGWDAGLPTFAPAAGPVATRDAGARAMNGIAGRLPGLIGGAADLASSTKTVVDGQGVWSATGPCGPNLHFGVRENAMAAMVNGLAVHGGLIPFGSTFLVFSDYARPAIRLAALMQSPSIFVFTHDSIALGEDGPSHQPVEQLVGLRAIPGLTVVRPADANETSEAWRVAVARDGPTALVFTRQKLPVLDPTARPSGGGVAQGAYVVDEASGGAPRLVLIGSGSEVHLCRAARTALESQGVPTRVVSMPSWELFDAADPAYRDRVLPPGVPRVAVEAGSPIGWERYVGRPSAVVGLNRFGASAPGDQVLAHLGFTVDHVVATARAVVGVPPPIPHP